MPELMTKQDAIEYLLYMKHDVQAKSPMDIALDTAIEELKQPTIEQEVRYGHWIDKGDYAVCSECDGRSGTQYDGVEPISLMTQYCPHCGAKMSVGDNNG